MRLFGCCFEPGRKLEHAGKPFAVFLVVLIELGRRISCMLEIPPFDELALGHVFKLPEAKQCAALDRDL